MINLDRHAECGWVMALLRDGDGRWPDGESASLIMILFVPVVLLCLFIAIDRKRVL
jgi:hypothetical protein